MVIAFLNIAKGSRIILVQNIVHDCLHATIYYLYVVDLRSLSQIHIQI
jgi:hypothetical protein